MGTTSELRLGTVKSFGRELYKAHDSESLEVSYKHKIFINRFNDEQPELDDYIYDIDEFPEIEEIDGNLWFMQNLNWTKETLINEDKLFCHILIDTETLFKVFPEKEAESSKVYSINGIYVIDEMDSSKNIKKSGRKPKYNWQEILAEIIRRFLDDKFTMYQNAFITEMQEWCVAKWGDCPSETSLKEYTSPFYKVKKESKINKK